MATLSTRAHVWDYVSVVQCYTVVTHTHSLTQFYRITSVHLRPSGEVKIKAGSRFLHSINSSVFLLTSPLFLFLSFFLQCNATCGEGVRNRKVRCMGLEMTPVQDDYCAPSSQPPSHQPCKGRPCHYMWITGEWSQVGRRDSIKTEICFHYTYYRCFM